ncbi:hypothetical protein A2368_02070 [Candidatus Collierbacteria bacterium RIFOXYB1_FULL_49_13]|uniref:UDP-N-acetylmuramyl-tripeptide synthetase n=1 Tax=Candidatus Collierbacteria bacterium RIFOXYB1_FULL_49_13 TaxID=1817728 RepID=A0A1F5FGK3_9BACT|nr:MAG: hypothetical protein A2368_02070 [Candidatus Collierbacteria bacterium RIFOXYB1_FULL_49_13]
MWVMRLQELTEVVGARFDGVVDVSSIVVDSRKVVPGSVFVAYKGVTIDGHEYVNQAVEKGAVAVVGERPMELPVPYFQVSSGRLAWAKMVAKWYGNPEKKLKIVGVTGTDGKTTTVNLIYEMLGVAGKKTAMVSTIEARVGDETLDTGLHTSSPDPDILWPMLSKMVEAGCEYAVLETTSHGLEQERFGDIEFEVGVLTNLAHDHLEFHKTIEGYADAKAKLFKRSKVAVLNKNANMYGVFEQAAKKVVNYDLAQDIRGITYIKEENAVFQKSEFRYGDEWAGMKTCLLGDYNLENILAAANAVRLLGIGSQVVVEAIEKVRNLKGRFEMVVNERGLNVVVDFAHTEQGMRQVLRMVTDKLIKGEERLIVVFGCNGERDRSKRAPMGKAACGLADMVVVTTEDPRKESVDQIFTDIERGCLEAGGVRGETYWREDDRRQAISMAINKLATVGDWILCLGKGHEQSMNIGGVETPWDEVSAVKEILAVSEK